MSKGSRVRNKLKRDNIKKARKAAKKSLYAKYAADGKVKGTKRSKAKVKLVKNKNVHPEPCGNPGCKKCYPELNIKKTFSKKTK